VTEVLSALADRGGQTVIEILSALADRWPDGG
jgi:hypothetical protein